MGTYCSLLTAFSCDHIPWFKPDICTHQFECQYLQWAYCSHTINLSGRSWFKPEIANDPRTIFPGLNQIFELNHVYSLECRYLQLCSLQPSHVTIFPGLNQMCVTLLNGMSIPAVVLTAAFCSPTIHSTIH